MPTENNDEREGERGGERIAKLLARAGIASRREVERMIAEGRIALDGVALDTPATVLRSLHGVTVDGRSVAAPAPARLFLYHKPAGLLVTERDPGGRPTIYDRLPGDLPRVVPVGRLDLATEGLLLLTTDGGVKRQLELPATGVERTYRARTYGDITQARLEALIEGTEIDGIRYGSIDANMERRTGANGWIELTLTEGKNREVRRVLEHLGLQVSRLIRTRYGPFVLGDLTPGEVGEARQVDLVNFRRALDAKRPRTEDRVAVVARATEPPMPPAAEPDRPLRKRAAPERPAEPARPRPAKPSSGWGTRARPSRPAQLRADQGDRGRERETLDIRPPREGGKPSPDRAVRARPERRSAGPKSSSARDDTERPSRSAKPPRGAPGPERPTRGGLMPGGVAHRGTRGAGSDRAAPPRDRPSGDRPRRGPAGPAGGGPRPPRKPR